MNEKPVFPLYVMLLTLIMVRPAAAVGESEIEELRDQLSVLSQRLDDLEASNRALREENARLTSARQPRESPPAARETAEDEPNHAQLASWAERIRLKGDFRMRHETIDQESRDERRRSRVRARAAIVADVNEEMEVGLGVASGGDDPVSTNQTLGGGGSSKGLNLDLAYFRWTGLENTAIVGGKFKNILHKAGGNGLLWDGDWNPEGVGLTWKKNGLFFNALGTWLESDSNRETEFAYGAQAGYAHEFSGAELTAGIAYYRIDTQDKGTFYGDAGDFFGNSYDPATMTYLFDYHEIELFADLDFDLAGRPFSLFLDYVQNQDAPAFDTGWATGFKYGSAKAPGSWEFGYTYQDLEADAAFGLLVDSDFGGGGTNSRGHVFKGGYAIARNWNAIVTYLLNEQGISTGEDRDYDRLQVDLSLRY